MLPLAILAVPQRPCLWEAFSDFGDNLCRVKSALALELPASENTRSGSDVYACDINVEALKSAATELRSLKTGSCNVGDRTQIEHMLLGEYDIQAKTALPGAVDGESIQRVFEAGRRRPERALKRSRRSRWKISRSSGLWIRRMSQHLRFFLASHAAKSISGQTLPIDADMQRNGRQADRSRFDTPNGAFFRIFDVPPRGQKGGSILRWRHP